MPDELFEQYRGQWIGFADGKVIASGASPVSVFQTAEASGRYPFLIWAQVNGQDYPCRVQADLSGHERILGRDLHNSLDLFFRIL